MARAVENWSDFLREPTRVLPQVERGEAVILKRRDGAALLLGLESRADDAQVGTEIAALVLAKVIPRMERALLAEALQPRLPWTRFLPVPALEEFGREFAETLEACASIGNMNRIAELLVDWKATAQAYADPALASDLRRPLPGTDLRVPRPAGGSKEG
jgi:hypothetical protein